eukprot:7304216-Pyramimonas_sp.AAC.1
MKRLVLSAFKWRPFFCMCLELARGVIQLHHDVACMRCVYMYMYARYVINKNTNSYVDHRSGNWAAAR